MISWPLKLIRDFRHDEWQMFDLLSDPGETQDLLLDPDRPTLRVAREMRDTALELRQGATGRAVELDERMLRDLRSLGYIQ